MGEAGDGSSKELEEFKWNWWNGLSKLGLGNELKHELNSDVEGIDNNFI